MKNALLLFLLSCGSTLFAQDISGSWNGTISIQGTELPLVFNLKKSAEGYTSTMDSPTQGAKDMPMDQTTFENKDLKISFAAAGIKYEGKWLNDNEIKGNFHQGAFTTPLNLKRGTVEIIRPQEPKKPFPYYSENVKFTNKKDNLSFGATLTLPKENGKFPAVILISGSGQQNRDSEVLGHKSFLVISDYLTRNGIAVLRYDDRGVGESEGDPTLSTSADFANDARAAIEYLRSRKEINTKNIGIIGHSEGGIIAPMIAATDKNIAFLVLLAGSGVPGDELLVDQNYQVGKLSGMSEEALAEAKVTNQTIYDIVKANADAAELKKAMTAFFQASVDKIPEASRPSKEELDKMLQQEYAAISSPWLRYFLTYNPKPNLKKVKVPVLVLNGEKDIQVSADLNTQAIANALKEGGNKNVKVQIFSGLNHLFQHCTTCQIDEYSKIEETFAPEVLKTITDWIQQQVKK